MISPDASLSIALCDDASLALEGEALALASEGGAPEWVQLLPKGPDIIGRDGRKWRLPDVGALVSAFNAHGGPLAIDWEHGQDRLAPQGHPAPAAGWIEAIETRDGETWGRVSWTDKAKAAIETREYRFLSPTFLFDRASGVIVSLAGAGLVNRPNLGMVALNSRQKDSSMDKELLKKLGLAENASLAEVLAAIDRMNATSATNSADLSRYVPRADYDAVAARAQNAEQSIAQAAQAAREAEIVRLVDEAVAAGKVAPASKDYHLASCRAEGGLERFKTFAASAPSMFTSSDPSKKDPAGGTQTALNAEERALLAMTNITEAEYLASKALGPVPVTA